MFGCLTARFWQATSGPVSPLIYSIAEQLDWALKVAVKYQNSKSLKTTEIEKKKHTMS